MHELYQANLKVSVALPSYIYYELTNSFLVTVLIDFFVFIRIIFQIFNISKQFFLTVFPAPLIESSKKKQQEFNLRFENC